MTFCLHTIKDDAYVSSSSPGGSTKAKLLPTIACLFYFSIQTVSICITTIVEYTWWSKKTGPCATVSQKVPSISQGGAETL